MNPTLSNSCLVTIILTSSAISKGTLNDNPHLKNVIF